MGYFHDTAMSVHGACQDLRIRRGVRFLSYARQPGGGSPCQSGLHDLPLKRGDEIPGAPRPDVLIVGGVQDEEKKKLNQRVCDQHNRQSSKLP